MDRDSDWENSKVSNALMLYPCRRSQIYRFISLAFAHRGLTHLFANCILTLWFGKIIKSASNSALAFLIINYLSLLDRFTFGS